MNRQLVFHPAASRGLADHGWLLSRHTFSFANYYDPSRMNFGLLRVINDDIVKPSMGFDTHPHENMEIVSIPLSGSLRHQDSMGHRHIISAGEVQIMSSGRGLTHSEYNNSEEEDVNFLQIWVFPQEKDIAPRYGQQRFDKADRHNVFQPLVSPDKNADAIWINQQAWFSMAGLDSGSTLEYQKHHRQHGLYFFVVEGEIDIAGKQLQRRDGLGVGEGGNVRLQAKKSSEVLCIEVPMK